jgi:hypothetical protein
MYAGFQVPLSAHSSLIISWHRLSRQLKHDDCENSNGKKGRPSSNARLWQQPFYQHQILWNLLLHPVTKMTSLTPGNERKNGKRKRTQLKPLRHQ